MKNPSLQNNDDNFLDAQEEMYEANEERLDKLIWKPLSSTQKTDLNYLNSLMKKKLPSTSP